MRIYTRTGDGGTTGLLGGGRVSKSEDRIQALGSIDELSAAIGVVIAAPGIPAGACVMLEQVQRDLFELGALVARPGVDATDPFLEAEVRWLEESIDRLEESLPTLDRFILPGGSSAGAGLHWARTVCRRAERDLVRGLGGAAHDATTVAYLNRLSDALFVLARHTNRTLGHAEEPWVPRGSAGGALG